MTKYETLCEEFKSHQDAVRAYQEKHSNFLRILAFGFRDYIGCPQYYEVHENGKNKSYPFIEFYKITDHPEEDSTYEVVKIPLDAFNINDDGLWEFGLGLTLQREPNMFPKHKYILRIAAKLNEDSVLIKLNGMKKTYQIDPLDHLTHTDIYDSLFEHYLSWLKLSPDDEPQKQPMGFAIQSSS